jgi:coenzyme F420-reducing hydrogenase delta subunit
MLGRATLVLDDEGAALSGEAPDQASVDAAVAALQVALGADVPLDVSVTVADGPLPEVVIAAADGEVRVGGFLPRRRVLEGILEAVEAAAGPSAVVNEMVVDRSRVDTYLLHRIPGLVERLAIGDQWSLRYDGVELAGAVAGRSVFKAGDSRIGAKVEGVLDGIGALMIADTRPGLLVEVASDTADSKAGNDDLSRDRLVATVIRLVRLGIEPDRIQTGVASGSGELLRFRLSSADR